jgi:salicylate hydroxylase
MGDAVHAMVPYSGMGAAQCIEDSACLSKRIDRAHSMDDLPQMLRAFETIRRPRVEYIVKRSSNNSQLWHLPDGEQQRERDAIMAQMSNIVLPTKDVWNGKNVDDPPPEKFGPQVNAYAYGFDIFDYVSLG